MADTSPELVAFLLRHVVLSRKVFRRAQALKATPDDFRPLGIWSPVGPPLVLQAAQEIGSAPIAAEAMMLKVQDLVARGMVDPARLPEVATMLARIYAGGELMEDFACAELFRHLKAVRGEQVRTAAAGDLDRLHEEYRKVIFPLQTAEKLDGPMEDRFHRPFRTLMQRKVYSVVSTGFPRLDTYLGGGLGHGSFGLIVGFSGCGKTALANAFARGAALQGYKVVYCSMEEEPEDLANRNYSAVFQIDYTRLRNGGGFMELEQRVRDGDEAEKVRLLQENLVLLDLKGMTPMKASRMKELIDEYAAREEFPYQMVVVDQLQFMEPETTVDGEAEWAREARVARELDEISHQPVAGQADLRFALWVLHQARGKVKLNFTAEDIAGFKGVIHKPETVLGIGREALTSDHFEVFSLKNRHAPNFRLGMRGELAHMSFVEQDFVEEPKQVPSVPRPAAAARPVSVMLQDELDRTHRAALLAASPIPPASPLPEALLGPEAAAVRADVSKPNPPSTHA
jgi:RecA/RadA recombinase